MISLSELDNINKAEQQQEQMQSALGKKIVESAALTHDAQYSPEVQSILDEVQQMREREKIRDRMRTFAEGGGIHIDPSKRGTFTAAASRHGMGVQEFASKVLANKENYSPAMVKKANFARNASHWHADGGPVNILAKGGPQRFANAAQMIEHFEGFRASPYRDGKAYSVGYGQYMYGDGANLDWNALLSGKRKLTREEGHQQVLRSIEKLKASLKRTLGDELYNSLTPGQLMGYLDTGYQRPASMINAAKIHRQHGAKAAASALGVNGFAERNAARRAAFTGNWGNDTTGFDYQYSPERYNSSSSLSPMLSSGYGATSISPIQMTSQDTGSSFKPWWTANSDEDFLSQQYAIASGAGNKFIKPQWFPEDFLSNADAPAWFSRGGWIGPVCCYADGGPYNDAFMDYYGYSWVPGNQIYTSDPYFRQIQDHNPNGTYAVDANGYYVPASTMKRDWEFYNQAPSMNTPSTAFPLKEVSYIMQDSDRAAVDAAKNMFGDNRYIIYDDLWNRGSASASSILNKLDTLARNSAYMKLNTNPNTIAKLKEKPYKLLSNGDLRAQYNTNTNTAIIEPVYGRFLEPYISEFVHSFQHNNLIPGIDIVGYNPRTMTKDRAFIDASYNDPQSDEYKAHKVLQPVMNQYLNNQNMSYADFVNNLKSAARGTLANR